MIAGGRAGARHAGIRSARNRAPRSARGTPTARRFCEETSARARSESPSRANAVRAAIALNERALREKPERYLWRFGYGRDGDQPDPKLELSVEGHHEQLDHTMYVIKCSLDRTDDSSNATTWNCWKRLCDLREELHDVIK